MHFLGRAVAGFYCPNGTVTSDPFRNDTTLRPYPCSPGSYCLGGVGFSEVRSGDYLYAQTCPAGFFCETARYISAIFVQVVVGSFDRIVKYKLGPERFSRAPHLPNRQARSAR